MADIDVVEGRACRLPLSPTQVDELAAIGRALASSKQRFAAREAEATHDGVKPSVIEIIAVGSGIHSVTVRNAIGVIALTRLTLRVRPKIDLHHFLYIAGFALELNPRVTASVADISTDSHLEELLARALVDEARRVLPTGLPPDYSTVEYCEPVVRGRIDVAQTARDALLGRFRVSGTASELTQDTALHRLIHEALARVARNDRISTAVRRSAANLRSEVGEAGKLKPSDLDVRVQRASAHFERLRSLSRVLVEAGGLGLREGTARIESFLISTPLLIEDGVRQILRLGLAPLEVKPHGAKRVIVQRPPFSANPDLLISDRKLTGDVKYRVSSENWSRSAVAQSVMFAAAFGSPLAFIVGFTSDDCDPLPPLPMGGVTVHELWWNASSTASPQESANELVTRVRHIAEPALFSARRFD